jgi:predicted nucleotide-binding protein
MATRKQPPQIEHANLSVDQMRKGIARLERLISEIETFDATKLTKRWSPEQTTLETTIEGTLTSVFGYQTVEYRRYDLATKLDHGAVTMNLMGRSRDEANEARMYVAEGQMQAAQILRSAIKWLHDEISDAGSETENMDFVQASTPLSSKIFIVHGHDDAARQSVARFIESMGFEAIILSEQASQGRTIIEKIEAHRDVGFAVVLLTPDDVGGKDSDSLRQRARQNVLLELGYFIGVLGRERVCTLAKGDLEIPTDFAGVVWEALDDGEGWKTGLARELKAAGYLVDWNKVMG